MTDFDDDIFNTPNFLRHLTSCFGSEMSDGSASTDTYGRDSPSFAQFLSLAPSNTQETITSVSTHQSQSRGAHGKVIPSKPPLAKSPVQSPRFYAERVTMALNSHDINDLYQCLKSLSKPGIKISKKVYSLTASDAEEKGVEEMVFNSLEEFCYFMEVWNMFLPDGVFETSFHRTCIANPPTFLFISNLHFTGQKIIKRVDILHDHLHTYYHSLPEIFKNHLDQSKYPEIIELSGSLVFYVNKLGFIEKLELYCCQHEQLLF